MKAFLTQHLQGKSSGFDQFAAQQLGGMFFAPRILFFLKTADVISQQKGSLKDIATLRSTAVTLLVSQAVSTELGYPLKRRKILIPLHLDLAPLTKRERWLRWLMVAIQSPQPCCPWSSNGSCHWAQTFTSQRWPLRGPSASAGVVP